MSSMPWGDATSTPLPSSFSWWILLLLLVVLTASVFMFRMLVLRWTVYHRWVELQRWADEKGLTLRGKETAALMPPFDVIKGPVAVMAMTGAKLSVIEMQTASAQRTDTSQYTHWHAVVKPIESKWLPTGLRPRANSSSLLDLFPLTSFPSMLPPERFVVFGTDSAMARRLAQSKLPALLPPDVGLLLHGKTVVIDFSSRPLDTIELSRMTAVVEQIVGMLPPTEEAD